MPEQGRRSSRCRRSARPAEEPVPETAADASFSRCAAFNASSRRWASASPGARTCRCSSCASARADHVPSRAEEIAANLLDRLGAIVDDDIVGLRRDARAKHVIGRFREARVGRSNFLRGGARRREAGKTERRLAIAKFNWISHASSSRSIASAAVDALYEELILFAKCTPLRRAELIVAGRLGDAEVMVHARLARSGRDRRCRRS